MFKWSLLAMVAAAFLGAASVKAAEDTPVGETTVVVRDVTGLLRQNLRHLVMEDTVYFKEVVESGEDSATEITFADGTTLTIGPNTRITLDSVVFDPDPSKGEFILSVTKGLLRLSTGDLPSTAYKVNTPTATIGVRGTVLNVIVGDPTADGP